jgi:hypothetical protein
MERTDTDKQFPKPSPSAKSETQPESAAAADVIEAAENHIVELKREEEQIEQQELKPPVEPQHKADALLVAALMGNSIAKFKAKSKFKSQLSTPAGTKTNVKPVFMVDLADGAGDVNDVTYKKSKSMISDNITHEIDLESRVDFGKLSKTNNTNNYASGTTPASSDNISKNNDNSITKALALNQKACSGSKPYSSSSNNSRIVGSKASKCIYLIIKFYTLLDLLYLLTSYLVKIIIGLYYNF